MPELGLLIDRKACRPSMQIRCLEYINLFPICIVRVLFRPRFTVKWEVFLLLQGKSRVHMGLTRQQNVTSEHLPSLEMRKDEERRASRRRGQREMEERRPAGEGSWGVG